MKTIGQRFVIKGTLNRKVGSGRPRAVTIKHDHMLKMPVLKGIKIFCLTQQKFKTEKRNSFSRLVKSGRVKKEGF